MKTKEVLEIIRREFEHHILNLKPELRDDYRRLMHKIRVNIVSELLLEIDLNLDNAELKLLGLPECPINKGVE